MLLSDAFKCAARAAVKIGGREGALGPAKCHAKCAERTLQDAVADVTLPEGRRPALSVHLAARQDRAGQGRAGQERAQAGQATSQPVSLSRWLCCSKFLGSCCV